jgi:hypothetical protein
MFHANQNMVINRYVQHAITHHVKNPMHFIKTGSNKQNYISSRMDLIDRTPSNAENIYH